MNSIEIPPSSAKDMGHWEIQLAADSSQLGYTAIILQTGHLFAACRLLPAVSLELRLTVSPHPRFVPWCLVHTA